MIHIYVQLHRDNSFSKDHLSKNKIYSFNLFPQKHYSALDAIKTTIAKKEELNLFFYHNRFEIDPNPGEVKTQRGLRFPALATENNECREPDN